MKNMIKDALILFAITLIAGLALGIVNEVTKEPIAQQEEKAKAAAYQAVFKDAAYFEDDENFLSEEAQLLLVEAGYKNADIDMLASAFNEAGELLGYVITVTSHAGFGGDITFSMGIRLDDTLNGISITSINETPGLGMNAGAVLVPQFQDKGIGSTFIVTKTGAINDSDIDAISGATITSRAIVDAANAGIAYYQSLRGGDSDE